MIWTEPDERLLLDLLRLDTTSPLESGHPGELPAAQSRFARAAHPAGLRTVQLEPAPASVLAAADVPMAVRTAATVMGPDFLAAQPNLVLACGQTHPARTIAFNFHMDTVAGEVPVRREGDLIFGRGAVDDKGPGVALLAGVRDALARRPDLPKRIGIMIASVSGEEGGAMGIYGTRLLAEQGRLGRLTVVAEPTRLGYLDRCTAAMTARISVAGQGSTDDEPELGENATLILGFLASWFGRRVLPAVHEVGGKACLAGLHTGSAHNRVYGTGSLLVNLSYPDRATAGRIETIVRTETDRAIAEFGTSFAGHPATAVTASAAGRIVHLDWLKRGLPTLDNRDPEIEPLLAAAGFRRHDPADPDAVRPLTCDAIWLGRPGHYTVVCGPGDLNHNNAHADSEHVSVRDLARYATRISSLVRRFADWCGPGPDGVIASD